MISTELLLNLSWATALIAIVFIVLIKPKSKAYIAALASVITALSTSIPALQALGGATSSVSIFAGSFLGSIPIKIDGLSAWFILIINFTSVTGAFYGIGYLRSYQNSSAKLSLHWSLYVVFQLSMVGFVCCSIVLLSW
jgi:formate hydrogenlyase subunit 3/multisubunit Na+/H+ antiporter MnhD subunit